MRNLKFDKNECYHIFGQGAFGTKIFIDETDLSRFLFLILHLQSPTVSNNVHWSTSNFVRKGTFGITSERKKALEKDRQIQLICFSMGGSEFDLIVQNLGTQAISVYMHRVLMAYSKYFNAKYSKKGHVFQGPFGANHIDSNEKLLGISAYIHKKPEPSEVHTVPHSEYTFSSFQDYIKSNRWGSLLQRDFILDQYKTSTGYKNFVDKSTMESLSELV
jgi:hypothetical protein